MFDYFNGVYWLIAFASLIAFARFCTYVAEDVKKNLVDLPELPWQLSYIGVLFVMFVVFVTMPSFWIALAGERGDCRVGGGGVLVEAGAAAWTGGAFVLGCDCRGGVGVEPSRGAAFGAAGAAHVPAA